MKSTLMVYWRDGYLFTNIVIYYYGISKQGQKTGDRTFQAPLYRFFPLICAKQNEFILTESKIPS